MIKAIKKLKKTLIIDRPEALGPFRRSLEWSITSIGWIIWFFLCRPVILILLWLLGFRLFYEHMIRLGGLRGLQEFFWIYSGMVLSIFLILRGWNVYNLRKFNKKSRRQNSAVVTGLELEQYFKMPPGGMKDLQGWKDISIDFMSDHFLKITDTATSDSRTVRALFNPTYRAPHPDPKKNRP